MELQELKINVYDFLDEDEIKDIVVQEFKNSIRRELNSHEFERHMSNITYLDVYEEVDKITPNYKETIAEKVVETISKDIGTYIIFRNDDAYGNKKSIGQKILDELVVENKEKIKVEVEKVLNKFYEEDLYYSIQENIERVVADILGKK